MGFIEDLFRGGEELLRGGFGNRKKGDDLADWVTGRKKFEEPMQKRKEELEEKEERVRERALERLKEARERVERATKLALGQLQIQQQIGTRLAQRAAAVRGLSAGGLGEVLQQFQESIGRNIMGLQQQEQEALARLAAMEADVEANIPIQFEQLWNQLLSVEAQMMQARAALMQAQPPSLFDRLIGVGSSLLGFYLLSTGNPAGLAFLMGGSGK